MVSNENEYRAAMDEIESLMDRGAAPGTPESDRLRALAAAVGDYERARFRLRPVDPVTAIRFRMEQAGLQPRDLIPYVGSRSRVSEVLAGKRPLTLEMIRNLHAGLGIPAESLIQEPRPPANADEPLWERFPIAEMRRRGWIPSAPRSRGATEEALKEFLSPVLGPGARPVLLKRTGTAHARGAPETDWYSLMAWSARVARRAQETTWRPAYSPGPDDREFLSAVAKLSADEDGPPHAAALLRARGVGFVVEPQLPGRITTVTTNGRSMRAHLSHAVSSTVRRSVPVTDSSPTGRQSDLNLETRHSGARQASTTTWPSCSRL